MYQVDENDCGVASLATVLNIFGAKVPYYQVKNAINLDDSGASLWDLKLASEKFGLIGEALEGDGENLYKEIICKEIPLPLIAHVIKENGQYHYVVILRVSKKGFIYFDPSKGKITKEKKSFYEMYTGKILCFKKDEKFKKIGHASIIQKSFEMMKEYRAWYLLGLLITLIISLFSILGSKFYQSIIDVFIIRNSNELIFFSSKSVFPVLSSFILLLIFQNILSTAIDVILTKVSVRIESTLYTEYYRRLFSLPMSAFNSRKGGDFLTRLQDIEVGVKFLSSTGVRFISNFLMFILGIIVLSSVSIELFLVVVVGMVFYCLASFSLVPLLSKVNRGMVEDRSALYSTLKEYVDCMESIKVNQKEECFINRLILKSKVLIGSRKMYSYWGTFFRFIINNVEDILSGCVLFLGILLIMNEVITLGSFLAFQSLMAFFITPIKDLITVQTEFQEFIVSSERLEEIQMIKSENYFLDRAENHAGLSIIRVEGLTHWFKNDWNVINNFDYEFKSGSKVYLEGKNGSGKSTLLKMLSGLSIPSQGTIYLDEIPYDQLPISTIRGSVFYSSQENYIFRGTLLENVFLGTEVDQKKIETIDRLVNYGILDQVFSRVGGGWDSWIFEGGTNLSEGQKQIIGICRMLIKDTPVMIFDENISKIDILTKERIIDYIFEYCQKNTCIFVDHGGSMKERCTEVIKIA